MEAVRDKWTDERLDDLNKKVDDGFADARAEFRSLRGEITGVRVEMNGMRGEMNGLRGDLHGEIAALQRLMIQLMVGLFGTMILGFAGLIMSHL